MRVGVLFMILALAGCFGQGGNPVTMTGEGSPSSVGAESRTPAQPPGGPETEIQDNRPLAGPSDDPTPTSTRQVPGCTDEADDLECKTLIPLLTERRSLCPLPSPRPDLSRSRISSEEPLTQGADATIEIVDASTKAAVGEGDLRILTADADPDNGGHQIAPDADGRISFEVESGERREIYQIVVRGDLTTPWGNEITGGGFIEVHDCHFSSQEASPVEETFVAVPLPVMYADPHWTIWTSPVPLEPAATPRLREIPPLRVQKAPSPRRVR